MLGVVGTISIIILIFSIILYIVAGGDEERIGQAGRFFGYFLIGAVISFSGIIVARYLESLLL